MRKYLSFFFALGIMLMSHVAWANSVDLVELAIEYDEDILAETMHEYKSPQGPEKDVYYTHNDHLGSAAWITDQDAKPVQYLHYLPYGQLLANQSPSGYDERFKFIGKERDWESGYDYFGARYYIAPFLHWMSVDPLVDKYPDISPYAYCRWNPIGRLDPDGRDWYEADGEIRWTELKSQQAMDKEKLAGRYLGEAVIAFNGYYDETLGKGNNLWGDGAKLATATVYGPNGCDDIATYDAFTMSSNYNEYGAIKNGDYSLDYIEDRTGPMGTHWAINKRGPVDCVNDYNAAWYNHKETNPYSATQKDKTYVHRCNLNGDMLPLGSKDGKYHPLSTGCLIIAPSRKGKPGWNEFNNQLQGVKKAFLRLTRQ